MPKSVFQQLVEETCAKANLKPSNNKAQVFSKPETRNPKLGPSQSASKPTPSVNEKRETSNEQRVPSAANRAPRCQHIKANGVRCASPAMRELPFCFFHEKFYNPPYDDSFPPLEDANSVQCAILQVLNGLKTKVITLAEARVMLYGLKAASINARRTTFEPIMQVQVTEYPRFHRQPSSSNEVVIPTPSAAQGEGPAVDRHPEQRAAKSRDQASQIEDFLRAAKEQMSSPPPVPEIGKPPASAKIVDVIVNNGSGAAH